MNSDLIMKSDVLDILFEKRNKAYGAYRLRKFYKNRLIKSLGAMVTAVIVFSAFTLLPEKDLQQEDIQVKEHEFGHAPSPKTPEVKPRVNKTAIASPTSRRKFLSSIIMVNKNDSADILHDPGTIIPGSTNIISNITGPEMPGAATDGDGGGDKQPEPTQQPLDITKPLDNPEIMPEFPGGMAALRKFLVKNLSNPRDLVDGELISVKVKFVVGYDGKLQRFELIQDGGSEFNNEVIRVLKKMPAWIPGRSKGQNVSVFYTIPVKFIGDG